MAGTGKRTQLLEKLKLISAQRKVPFQIHMKTLSYDSGNASTVAKGEQDDDEPKSDNHTIEYESSFVHIGFDIARMSMQDKNILRPVLINYGKGSNVISGDGTCGNRIIVLYHAHLLSSESILVIQSVLEQNNADISIWMTSELPIVHRIRDWFVEVPVSGNDKAFELFTKTHNKAVHNWNDVFKQRLLSWNNSSKPTLSTVPEIKKFVYELLMRNLRWVECVHFLLDVIIEMKEINEQQRLRLLEVLANIETTGGGLTLPSYRIPIVWENLFINLRNAIIDDNNQPIS
jgi:hypothetical protein